MDTEHRETIVCPHCGHEHEDSQDWGCPDVEWTEPGQCAHCEGEFEWSRDITVTYSTRAKAANARMSNGEGETQ
jgi:hypothetical protein